MNKKKFISLMMAVTLSSTVMLSSCSNGSTTTEPETNNNTSEGAKSNSSKRVEISFINGFTGGDGEFMRKITDGFNESQSKFFVVESQETDHYTKFKSDDYDMLVVHGDLLSTYIEDGLLQNVDAIYDKSGLTLDEFHEAGAKIVTYDDLAYAFPLDIHPLTMFYNKELVSEAPKTYEDILALNENLQASNPNQYAMAVPGAGLSEWYMMMLANQRNNVISNGDYMDYNTDEFAKSLLQLNKMIFEDKVSPANLGLDGEFKAFMQEAEGAESVQSAISLTGPWFYTAAKEKYGDNLGVAPIAVFGENAGTYGNAHLISVSSKVENSEVLEGIAEFLKYLYTPENLINWADGGQAPLHKETMELVKSQPDKYPLAIVNFEQFDNCKIAPQVYNSREQSKYLNESVYTLVVTTPNLTKDELMAELVKATNVAKEVSEER